MSAELSWLQQVEREAITGMPARGAAHRHAVLEVVGALRQYRQACAELLASRYGDGACDAVALSKLAHTIETIENPDDSE